MKTALDLEEPDDSKRAALTALAAMNAIAALARKRQKMTENRFGVAVVRGTTVMLEAPKHAWETAFLLGVKAFLEELKDISDPVKNIACIQRADLKSHVLDVGSVVGDLILWMEAQTLDLPPVK